ncbi:hypothetical protein L3X38_036349 [Prunus dulcis]|uniref:Uncharacterized protein n=1 Tax=Prunus dulcis TaxID=3755 RepID=A0AAD4YNH3_PRUDU|nr:hypothetical protein L3X38_036349 [Prunus dulcis]
MGRKLVVYPLPRMLRDGSRMVQILMICRLDSKKTGSMHNIRDVPLKPHADKLGDRDLLPEVVRARSSSVAGRQKDADILLRSSAVESRAVNGEVDSALLTPLEVRMATAKKTRQSSVRAKGFFATSTVDPKVDKSSSARDAGVSDMLKTNFLSSSSTCAELVDQIHQDGDLDAYFRLERQNADISLSYDKLFARFRAYHKSIEESKFEATMDVYKPGCLDCKNGHAPFYATGDGDIEELCPDLLPVQSEQVNAANME